jgi:hypothetical protein
LRLGIRRKHYSKEENGTVLATRSAFTGSNRPLSCARTDVRETVVRGAVARRIAWQAVSDQFRIGVVFLDPLDDATTKVTVKLRSIIEPLMLTGALRNYLRNFKRFVEQELEHDRTTP